MTDMSTEDRRRTRSVRAWLAPIALATAVVAGAAGVYVVQSGGSDGPPRLRLTGVAAGSLGQSGSEPALGAPVGGGSGRGEWKLVGDLPQGPSAAPVHRLPAGDSSPAFVDRLAVALRISEAPRHLDGGWYAVQDKRELSVSERAGRSWLYADHGCLAGPVLDPRSGTACAVAEPADTAVPEPAPSPGSAAPRPNPSAAPTPRPVSEQDARRVARPVLEAVGLDPSSARLETAGERQILIVRPRVADSPVIGLDTRIVVGADSSVEDASGWLAQPQRGDDYPVISAREAFDQLSNQPQPMLPEMPCEIPPGATACPAPPDREVTGARLGLVQAHEGNDGTLLVPAWLFDVRGQSEPAVVLAVAPDHLGDPEEPASGGTSPGGSGGGTSGGSGIATADPSQVEPAPK